MVLVLAKEGKTDKATELIDKIIKAQPDNPLNQIAKGQFLHEVDKTADAVKAYEEAIDLIKKDDDLTKEEKDDFISGIRYTLSGLHIDLNDVDKATADLKELLEKEPDNPGYNNDLGYIWADHDMNLAEAEKMIRKALEDDKKQRLKANPDMKPDDVKDNASYLDSLGWVLFKEKKYKEANRAAGAGDQGPRRPEHRDLRPPRRGANGQRRQGGRRRDLEEGPGAEDRNQAREGQEGRGREEGEGERIEDFTAETQRPRRKTKE